MKFLFILSFPLFILSCSSSVIEQPVILGSDHPFDISKLNFNENIPLLFSAVTRIDGGILDSAEFRKLDYTQLLYKNEKAEMYKLQVPKSPYGFIFHAYEDSLMHLDSLYFSEINVLTNMDTSFSAMYAVCEMRNRKKLNAQIRQWKQKFGKPSLEVLVSSEFNVCAYEWDLKDRVLQIETSHGFSFGTDTARNGKYYKIEMLLVKKSDVAKLKAAHMHHFNKEDDFKLYQLDQDQLFPDDFLLKSTFDYFKNDTLGLYSIERADTLE